LEEKRLTLVETTVTQLWANPFWQDRFGERGKRYFYEDSNYHIDTLITVIHMDSPQFLTQHYAWLRGVLVHRGMCSRHLLQTLTVFDEQVAAQLPTFWDSIRAYAATAYDGLVYADPACQILAQAEERLAVQVTQRILQEKPAWALRLGTRGEALCYEDVRYHLSFLQDALGFQEPQIFTDYLAWISGFLEARRLTPQMLHLSLSYLAQEIEQSMPAGSATAALQLLRSTAVA